MQLEQTLFVAFYFIVLSVACLLRNEVTGVGVFSFFVVLSEREAEVVRGYMEEGEDYFEQLCLAYSLRY